MRPLLLSSPRVGQETLRKKYLLTFCAWQLPRTIILNFTVIFFFFLDVDPPRDLMAVNVQTDSATLTWQPPTAAVSGYVLTFFSSDDAIRVCTLLNRLLYCFSFPARNVHRMF